MVQFAPHLNRGFYYQGKYIWQQQLLMLHWLYLIWMLLLNGLVRERVGFHVIDGFCDASMGSKHYMTIELLGDTVKKMRNAYLMADIRVGTELFEFLE
jgi:hypothetical protein